MSKIKENVFNILNGMSLGVVIALMPEAFFGQLSSVLGLGVILPLLKLCTSLMGATIGVCVAMRFKLDAIASATMAMVGLVACRNLSMINEQGFLMLKGTGDIINCFIGLCVALVIILKLQDKLGVYKLIVLPALTLVVVAIVTYYTAIPISQITITIGKMIHHFTTLQPLLMCILIGISFGVIIVSPLSSAAVALLISISGIGSAAATIGIASMALALAIMSYKENGLPTSLAVCLGSPKLQLANFIKRPQIVIPGIISAAISCAFVPTFNLQGTPMSGGFGLTGMIGPLGHLNIVGYTMHNLLITLLCFIIIPFIASLTACFISAKILKIVNTKQYKVEI